MIEKQPTASHRLHWRFWLLLFAPALVSLGATALGLGLGGVFFVNVYIALPLNFVCSNAAAKQLVLLRDSRGGSSLWMFLWGR